MLSAHVCRSVWGEIRFSRSAGHCARAVAVRLPRMYADRARVGRVHGDGEGAADVVKRGREAVLEKAHEGGDGGEPRVARAGAVGPLVLEMVEEREHEGRVAVLDLGVRGGDVEAAARERE